MFKWYANYCKSRPAALRMFYSFSGEEAPEDRWSHLDKPKPPKTGFQMSHGEVLGAVIGSAGISAWAKNVGRSSSNIINDTAQETGNIIAIIIGIWFTISIADGLLRLPYFLVTQPVATVKALRKWLIVRFGDTHPPLVVLWWILVPALILNAFGLLDWLGKYF